MDYAIGILKKRLENIEYQINYTIEDIKEFEASFNETSRGYKQCVKHLNIKNNWLKKNQKICEKLQEAIDLLTPKEIEKGESLHKAVNRMNKLIQESNEKITGVIIIAQKENDKGQFIAQQGLMHSELRECLSIATYYNEKLDIELNNDRNYLDLSKN